MYIINTLVKWSFFWSCHGKSGGAVSLSHLPDQLNQQLPVSSCHQMVAPLIPQLERTVVCVCVCVCVYAYVCVYVYVCVVCVVCVHVCVNIVPPLSLDIPSAILIAVNKHIFGSIPSPT